MARPVLSMLGNKQFLILYLGGKLDYLEHVQDLMFLQAVWSQVSQVCYGTAIGLTLPRVLAVCSNFFLPHTISFN